MERMGGKETVSYSLLFRFVCRGLSYLELHISWVIVDQELSLFSDTTPLLNVVNLQAPMPSSESLYSARSAKEWSSRRNEIAGNTFLNGASLRDLFTRFVEGELSSTDVDLSPLQLRLLLHPLQTLVCQLRQFLSCLPETGRQPMGTSISKVAIKARLEEISTLLRQWYGFCGTIRRE